MDQSNCRTSEWFKARFETIEASDGACILDKNKYQKPYMYIVKRCIGIPYVDNQFTYHQRKSKKLAEMIYAYRMNVQVEEFKDVVVHPTVPFLAARLDGVYQFKNIERMVEIECPLVRKIKKGVPIYYWIEILLKLECCNLEECDFWQCKIKEYSTREEFIADTDSNEPFRSKKFGFEKGCLIQLVPKSRMNDIQNGKYLEDAIFIYPKKIEMSPNDCDLWVSQNLSSLHKNPEYNDYVFDKVIYWRLEDSMNVTIQRDREWFAENLPKLEKMWNYILFFRENKKQLDYFIRYLNSRTRKDTKDIMEVVDKLSKPDIPEYDQFLEDLDTDSFKS